MSRLVMMPTSVPSPSTTGRPEMRNCPQSASTSATVASGVVVTGLVIMPDSLTLDLVDVARLVFDREVAVQDAEAALARHRDRHARLGDGVHRAESSGVCDADAAGQPRGGVRLARDDVGVPGQQHDVVVGESDETERIGLVH